MTINQIIVDVVNSIPQKIYEVVSTSWGQILALFIFCGSFLGDRTPLMVYIGLAILADAFWGIYTAIKAKRFIFSKLLVKSAIKIFAYVTVYGLIALIEKGFADGEFMVTSSAIAAILISSELWSILGHIGIAYPDFLVVKILKKYLRGEMSKKLGIPEDELDEILKQRKDDKKTDNNETK